MSCNCLRNSKSQKALANARLLEQKTGKKYAIYKLGKQVYYGELSIVKKMGVDYFTTDEQKHKGEVIIVKPVEPKKKKK